jgi:UDP-glucose:(heptosyl)LPS alpha-1,3-glucosyltransferase
VCEHQEYRAGLGVGGRWERAGLQAMAGSVRGQLQWGISAPESGGCGLGCPHMASTSGQRRLRVGFLIDRWDPRRGGAERALATLATWLEARGHEVLAFALSGPPPGQRAPGTLVQVQTHGLRRSTRERNLARALLEASEMMRCDVTVGIRHLPRVDLYWPHGGVHAATLRELGKQPRGRHRAFLALESQALDEGGARRIVCVSELVRQEMLDIYPNSASRLIVVPNGLDTEQFCSADRGAARSRLLELSGGAGTEPILTFVGRNAELKGLALLLESLAGLQARPWRLVVAGPPDAKRWSRRAAAIIDHPKRVHVTPELDPVLAAAGSDLLVLPSRRDPCPLVVLEALAAGTPVLVSSSVGAKEAISDPQQGRVFPVEIKPRDLGRLISEQLDRIESGSVDRASIASAVDGRSLDAWMQAMEEQVLEIACSTDVG